MAPLHHGEIRPFILAARLSGLTHRLHMQCFADLESWDRAGDDTVERIVDVGGHRRVVRRLLHRLRNIDLSFDAVRPDRPDEEDPRLAVAFRVVERHRTLRATSLLGQDLRPALIRLLIGAVRIVLHLLDLIDRHRVSVRKPRRGHLVRGAHGERQNECANHGEHHNPIPCLPVLD